ncbi:dinucleotide-utilizing enzyme [Microbacterium sp.]|uniref:dinucleotide-utilizing enzyme n=1 Tax=Microbacterium sp. TaxID=51671 RepID=UPI00333EB37D
MKTTTSLTRSIPYLGLIVLSLAAAAGGGWLASRQINTMTTTILAGTATGVDVYAGQSWTMVGAALLGSGVLGLLLALALAAAKALIPRAITTADQDRATDHDRAADEDAPVDQALVAPGAAAPAPGEEVVPAASEDPVDAEQDEPAITR